MRTVTIAVCVLVALTACKRKSTTSERAPAAATERTDERPALSPALARPEPGRAMTPAEAVALQLGNAKAASSAGNYSLALQLCEEVIAHDGNNADALAVCARAACEVGDSDKARGFAAEVADEQRAEIAQACQQLGIEL